MNQTLKFACKDFKINKNTKIKLKKDGTTEQKKNEAI